MHFKNLKVNGFLPGTLLTRGLKQESMPVASNLLRK